MCNKTLVKTEPKVVGQAETEWKIFGWNGLLAPLVRSKAHCIINVPTGDDVSSPEISLCFHLKSTVSSHRVPTSLNYQGYSNGSISEATTVPLASYTLLTDVLSPQENVLLKVSVKNAAGSKKASIVAIEPNSSRENVPVLENITTIVPDTATDPEFLISVTAFEIIATTETEMPSSVAPHFVTAFVFYEEDSLDISHCVEIPSRTFSGNDKPSVTLAMLKEHLPKLGSYRYFFKRQCPETKATSEWEATADNQELPMIDGKITAYLRVEDLSVSSVSPEPKQLRNEIPTQSSTFPYTFVAPSEKTPSGEAKREIVDDRFREFIGLINDDVNKMREIAAKMQAVVKCYTQDDKKRTAESSVGFEQLQHTVNDADAAQAFQTMKTWLLQNNVNSEARMCLARLENICFSSGL